MHRLATLMDPNVGQYTTGVIDSEWVLGHHLRVHNMSVSSVHGRRDKLPGLCATSISEKVKISTQNSLVGAVSLSRRAVYAALVCYFVNYAVRYSTDVTQPSSTFPHAQKTNPPQSRE